MFICSDCQSEFENPKTLVEKHGLSTPPYEKICVCPHCKSTNFKKNEIKYCHYCGARLSSPEKQYCNSSCEIQATKLRLQEFRRRKQCYDSYIYKTVRELEEYNRLNKTRFSYGQYVALVKGDRRGKCKNGKR